MALLFDIRIAAEYKEMAVVSGRSCMVERTDRRTGSMRSLRTIRREKESAFL